MLRIEIHYLSQDVPAVAVCFCPSGSLQYILSFGWFLTKRTIRTATSVRVCVPQFAGLGEIARNLTLPLLLKFN